jgi:hypothetical protein
LAKQKRWVCVGGINALWAAFVTPLNIQKYPSVMLLKVSPCPLPINVVHVSVGGLIWSQWAFLLLFSSSLSPQNYSSALLVVSNSIFVFILLISNVFYLEPFVHILFVFNFILPSQFTKYYIPPMWSLFIRFLFSIIGSFVKVLVVFNFIF